MRVVIITTAIAFTILAGILVLDVLGGTGGGTVFLQFGLALVMFLAIIVGSYGFVYWAGGGEEE